MALKLISSPIEQPLTLTEVKQHLRVNFDDDDGLIELYIAAATAHVDGKDGFLGRALIDQTWELTVDAFPTNEIKIPLPPLIEVVSVIYDDGNGDAQTMDAASYVVDNVSEPGWIVPVGGTGTWPTPFDGINAVRVRYRAGYVDLSDSPAVGFVPPDIKAALLMMIGTLYANRETVVVGQTVANIPLAAEQLLRRKRIELSIA